MDGFGRNSSCRVELNGILLRLVPTRFGYLDGHRGHGVLTFFHGRPPRLLWSKHAAVPLRTIKTGSQILWTICARGSCKQFVSAEPRSMLFRPHSPPQGRDSNERFSTVFPTRCIRIYRLFETISWRRLSCLKMWNLKEEINRERERERRRKAISTFLFFPSERDII